MVAYAPAYEIHNFMRENKIYHIYDIFMIYITLYNVILYTYVCIHMYIYYIHTYVIYNV